MTEPQPDSPESPDLSDPADSLDWSQMFEQWKGKGN